MKRYLFTATFAMLLAASLNAQSNQITVAADSSSGTYKKLLGEVVNLCSTQDFEIVENTNIHGGAVGNLDALVNNKVMSAFLHSDVFFANSQADTSYQKYKTLLALWPEPIHVLTLRVSKTTRPQTAGIGSYLKRTEIVQINSLADTKGLSVGASGGGVFTARILQGQGEGGFTVMDLGSGDAVVNAVANGTVAAGIFVGGAPLPNIEKLDKATYRLVGLGSSIQGRVQGVYRPASINYPGLTNGPLQTAAPVATLITRSYTTPKLIQAQAHFRRCFYDHLSELQDTGSPSWQDVTSGDRGTLNNWLELTTNTPAIKPAIGR